jgi:transcriptional regulator with AAA-type ATPase domain
MTVQDGSLNPLDSFPEKPKLVHHLVKSNLQEFANKVDLLCALETGGKISAEDAYAEIRNLWKELNNLNSSLLKKPLESEA